MATWNRDYTEIEAMTTEYETVVVKLQDLGPAQVFLNGVELITGEELLAQRQNELINMN